MTTGMITTPPAFMGSFSAIVAGDIDDYFMDITGALGTDTISGATFAVLDPTKTVVAGAVSNISVASSGTRVNFRLSGLSAAGQHEIKAVFTSVAGKQLSKYAYITCLTES